MTGSLLESFVGEARELLQGSATALLVLEKNQGDEAAINEVFRSVHTLKGSVGLFDFPAFSKLIHAGEDVLSAVRDGQLALTSALVDMLLDALDQVGAWVDDIATAGALSEGADGVSRDMTANLRAALPVGYGMASADAAPAGTGNLASVDWLALVPESDRLSAFAATIGGAEILAIEYIPNEQCFFSGEDPFILVRQLPNIHSLAIEPTEPWATIEALDPYRCVIRFRVLATASRPEVETLFRYVIDQAWTTTVPPHALILPAGDATAGPAEVGFIETARRCIATTDWPALRRAVDASVQAAAPASLRGSALRWLGAVISAPAPQPAWAAALVDCIATGNADLDLAGSEATAAPPRTGTGASKESGTVPPSPTPALPTTSVPNAEVPLANVSRMAGRILDCQRTILRLPMPAGGLVVRLDSVACTVANLLSTGIGNDAHGAAWATAVDTALAEENAASVLGLLDRWRTAHDVPGPTDTGTTVASDDPARPRPGEPPSQTTKPANRVLKVDQAKIDTLMNLIGELVVSKNSLPFLARRAEQVYGSREMGREIKDLHAVIDRLAQEMQSAIMAVRMLPVSDVFDRFPRLVRDVSRKLGKQIDLVVEGADTAADKNIIEALNDPLLHIVRNAIDHGIEAPEDRDDVGKPTRATVRLRAFQESDQVVIEVVDDGRGIDPEKIKASALSKGIIDDERAARLTDQEAVNLVFTPGFSTVAKVTDLSGRGVGMDVVVDGMRKAGGTVTVTSVKDTGTTVRLSLPLSMAVTRVMVVEAGGGMLFGIPMDQIAETVRVHRDDVRHLKQSEAFVLRDVIVPLMRLDRLLGIEAGAWFGDGNEEDAVLVVRSGRSLVGLVVDRFHENMDIILKPFDGILANIQGYSGSALLGDGRVLLVLNLKEHL